MRRFLIFIMTVVLLSLMVFSVSAEVTAPKASIFATVNQDGSCQVTVTVMLHITEQTKDLTFPVPGDATGITVNGSRASSSREGDIRQVNLNRALSKAVGDVSFTVHYTLYNVIYTTETGALELRMPMLSGFAYGVEVLEFSVTLPGNISSLPGFESGYHQRSIEQDLTYRVDGAVITGNNLAQIKDHETLTLLLTVEDTMFPQSFKLTRNASGAATAMGICAALAFLYWLIFLRFVPWKRQRSTEPPEGRTAGELGCVMYLQGVDLTMTVLSWARLGYVTLQPVRGGRVLIHKRMDMGNERKSVEQRLFNTLFAKDNTVDTGSARYARLQLETGKKPMAMQEQLRKRSGNPVVFRVLGAGIGLCGGIAMAIAISGEALLLGLMILLLGALGGLSGWYVQLWGGCLGIRNPGRLILCLVICGLWLLMSLLAGIFTIGLWMVLGLLAAGILLSWGGLRTEEGSQEVARVQGLRQYLRTANKEDLQRLCEIDPNYFFDLAPCAITLGVGDAYAKRFAGVHLENCPYIISGGEKTRSAKDWIHYMTRIVNAMNARGNRLPWDRFLRFLGNIRK